MRWLTKANWRQSSEYPPDTARRLSRTTSQPGCDRRSDTTSGRTAVTALDTITGRLLGAVETAQLSLETYQTRVGVMEDAAREAYFLQSYQAAISAWNEPPLTVKIEPATGSDPAGAGIKTSGFTQSSSGMIVQFAVFGLINSAMLLMVERKTRCLQRLLTTPIRPGRGDWRAHPGHVPGGFRFRNDPDHIGQYVFGVDYLRQPLAILLMMVALALWASSLGLLIGALAKREDQVIVLSLIAMFLFSALGGAWFPLDVAGKAFSAVGHVLPSAWAIDGFQNIILRGLGINSVLFPAGLLLAYSLAFFLIAIWHFKFE